MDRNPSPPVPSRDDEEEEGAGGDCIGSTVYSKHWLFGVLSGLIQVWKTSPRVGSLSLLQPLVHAAPSGPGSRHPPEDPSRDPALRVVAAAATPKLPGDFPGTPQHKGRYSGRDTEMLKVKIFYLMQILRKCLIMCIYCSGFCSPFPVSFLQRRARFILWMFVVEE